MAMEVNAASRWRIVADAGLRLRFWGEECVLFHGASGDTHRLPEPVGRLLRHLLAAPASARELSDAIDLHEEDVAQALRELMGLGITQPAPPDEHAAP